MHVSKQPLCKYISFTKRARLKRNITVTGYKKRFSLHCPYIGIIIYENACNIIKGSPNNAILTIIAFCNSFDDICLLTHYIQSYEFLYYTDTLRKKQRAFIRHILPYIPPKSTIESKKILLFQKFIRKSFKDNFKICSNIINSVGESKTRKIIKRINKFGKVFYNVFVDNVLSKSKGLGSGIADQTDYKHRICQNFSFRKHCKSICNVVKSYSLACVSTLGRNVAKIRNMRQKYDDVMFNNLSEILDHYPELSGDLSTPTFQHSSDTVLRCKFYEKFKDNKHLEDILCIVDLLVHYIFTINSCKNVCTDHLSQINVARYYIFEHKLSERGSMNRHTSESQGLDVMLRKVMRSLNYGRNLTHHLKELGYLLNESPMNIIKEILESCIIFINSSRFDVSYYDNFLLRLSIAQAVDGYLILAYSLINRSLNNFNRVNVSNIDMHCSLEIDHSFKLKMLNKIALELVDHTKNYGIKPVLLNKHIKKYLLGLNFNKHVVSSDNPQDVLILATNEHYTDAKLLLMAGVSYLRRALVLPPAASKSITNMGITTLYVDTYTFSTMECIVFTGENELNGPEFVNADYIYSCESYLGLAVDNILKSLAIDPLDYKSWLYLAHCGLFSHNLQFSHACAKRCIDCYDMCLPAWLILIISMSSRIRVCPPFRIDKTILDEYMSKTTIHNEPFSDMVQIKAIPPPFEPILISEIKDIEHLDSYFNNSIGGNISICISTIESILYHDCTYLNTALIQILFRDSEFYNPLFLWEKGFFSRRSTKSNVMAMTVLAILKMCKGDAIEQNVNILSMKKCSINEPFDSCYSDIKKMVGKIHERRLHVCVVPFMSIMTNILLDKSYNFRCNNHKNQTYSKSLECNTRALEEEIYAWITCIETLSQIEEYAIARLLLPVLDVYLDSYGSYIYSKRGCDKFNTNFSVNKFESGIVTNFDKPDSIAIDLSLEADYLKYYIKCCNISGSSNELRMILREINVNSYGRYLRKMLLLETRLLVGLKLYNDAIQLSNLIHRANVKLGPNTDVVLEYQSLKAYALALEKTGDKSRSNFVKTFAKQYYLTTPLIKYDLCLNVPL